MEKNVDVADENGMLYGSTYQKRAKSLVKNGRARWVDEKTICLARSPDLKTEEHEMDKSEVNIIPNGQPDMKSEPTALDILSRIDLICAQNEGLNERLDRIADERISKDHARALSEALIAREATNREILAILREMYKNTADNGRVLTDRELFVEKLSTMNFMGMSADSAKVIVRTLREVLDPDGGRA